jgi:hypothetical protein
LPDGVEAMPVIAADGRNSPWWLAAAPKANTPPSAAAIQ